MATKERSRCVWLNEPATQATLTLPLKVLSAESSFEMEVCAWEARSGRIFAAIAVKCLIGFISLIYADQNAAIVHTSRFFCDFPTFINQSHFEFKGFLTTSEAVQGACLHLFFQSSFQHGEHSFASSISQWFSSPHPATRDPTAGRIVRRR